MTTLAVCNPDNCGRAINHAQVMDDDGNVIRTTQIICALCGANGQICVDDSMAKAVAEWNDETVHIAAARVNEAQAKAKRQEKERAEAEVELKAEQQRKAQESAREQREHLKRVYSAEAAVCDEKAAMMKKAKNPEAEKTFRDLAANYRKYIADVEAETDPVENQSEQK